jgi:hypothetical protein
MSTFEILLLAFGGNTTLLIVLAFLARSLVNNWLAKDIRRFEADLKARSDAAIEGLKASYGRELEAARHELELESSRMSVVFEHQKDSFRAILTAMHRVISAIYAKADPDRGWYPISEAEAETFKAVIVQEGLFVGARCQRILDLFSSVMLEAVEQPFDSTDSDTVYRAYDQLKLLSRAVAGHFRERVGLETEPDPLRDAELLGACRLINRFGFPEAGFPTKGVLAMGKRRAAQLVHVARDNIDELRQEIVRLKDYIHDKKTSGVFFEVQTDAEEYLRLFTAPGKQIG